MIGLGPLLALAKELLAPIFGAGGRKVAEEIDGKAELARRREAEQRERAQTEMGAAQLEDDYSRIERETK